MESGDHMCLLPVTYVAYVVYMVGGQMVYGYMDERHVCDMHIDDVTVES